jgi:hypothetical protein
MEKATVKKDRTMLGAYKGNTLIASNLKTEESIETYKGMGFDIRPVPQSCFGDEATQKFTFDLARYLGLFEEDEW